MSLTEKTEKEFFGIIYSKNLDVHPTPHKDKSVWKFRDGKIYGIKHTHESEATQ